MSLFGRPNLFRLEMKRDVKGLIKVLANRKLREVRRDAARLLGELGDVRAVEPLITALSDEDAQLRAHAAEALTKLADVRAIEPLAVALDDEQPEVRWHAAVGLAGLGDTRAVRPPLVAATDPETSRPIENAARNVAYRTATPRSSTPARAIEGLRSRAVEPLIAAFDDEDPKTRSRAASVLSSVAFLMARRSEDFSSAALEPLIAALGHAHAHVRRAAAEQDGTALRDPRAVEAMITILGDEDVWVRYSAARALRRLGDVRAVEPLVRALHDEFFSVADQAAYALGSLGDARAVEPLVQALNGPHEETGRGCHEGQAQAGEIRV